MCSNPALCAMIPLRVRGYAPRQRSNAPLATWKNDGMDAVGRSGRGILVFDGDCAFCTSSLNVLRRLIPAMPETVPFQCADLDDLGLTRQEAAERVWFVTDRRQFGGQLALAAILRRQPVAWQRTLGWLATVPPWSWAADAVYDLLARNRHRLPGGTPACRLDS
jgi:Uncharacterized protein conserved in bacteria